MTGKSYVEIFVPLDTNEKWYSDLKECLSDVDVIWQNAYYHITMAFVDDTPEDTRRITCMLKKRLDAFHAPILTFDSIDAFTTPSGMHFVTLKSSFIPADFINVIDKVRQDITDVGGRLESEFKLHVTLGRVKGFNISLGDLQERLNEFMFSPIKCSLTEVDYRRFRGEVLFKASLSI